MLLGIEPSSDPQQLAYLFGMALLGTWTALIPNKAIETRRFDKTTARLIGLGGGLLLGVVGSGIGMAGGLLFVRYINNIETFLSKVTGRRVFDDSIYYFNEIPTRVDPWTVAWIVGGALLISAVACIWPAQRAARLHPVRALRFE